MTPDQQSLKPVFSEIFDVVYDRRESESIKANKFPADVLPMWVADMDFKTPEPILAAFRARIEHGIFGYTQDKGHKAIIKNMLETKYDYRVSEQSIIFVPCLVSALGIASIMAKAEGGKVIVPAPCYPPFLECTKDRNIKSADEELLKNAVVCQLTRKGMDYDLDISELDAAADKGGTYLIFCDPQNPTGYVSSREKVIEIAEWAVRRNITIVHDAIHNELILDPTLRHVPIAGISDEIAKRTITLMAPSKTFNIAGIGIGFAVISDPGMRARFSTIGAHLVPDVSVMGYAAIEPAYTNPEVEAWRQGLLNYLRVNRDLLCSTLQPYSELVQVSCPSATYLSWIDCANCAWENPWEMFKKAGVALGDGKAFQAEQFVRLTFGCPRSTLMEGLKRITSVLDARAEELGIKIK